MRYRDFENIPTAELRRKADSLQSDIDDLEGELSNVESEIADREQRDGRDATRRLPDAAIDAVRALIDRGGLTGGEFESLFDATEGVSEPLIKRLRAIFQNHGMDARIIPPIGDCDAADRLPRPVAEDRRLELA